MPKFITTLTYKIEELAAEAGFIFRLASGYYKDVIDREILLANIKKDDNILCIGGGICPFSAILLHQRTGARVTIIDNNDACIPKAKELVRRLELCEHLEVIHQDGLGYDTPFWEYSVIHIAMQVSPMEQVFARVVDGAQAGTRLLIRRPKKHLSSLYCPSFAKALEGQAFTEHNSGNIGCTLLYTKQDGA